jgi:hypothetical protein
MTIGGRAPTGSVPPVKLLIVGSFVVLLSVVTLAAVNWATRAELSPSSRIEPAAPILRFVSFGQEPDGSSRSGAIVWQTSTGLGDCTDLLKRRKRDEAKRLRDLLSSAVTLASSWEDENACAPFQLGEVERGVKVEILGDWGRIAKIRILSGRLEGRQGYIESRRLSVDAAGASPRW